MPDNNQNSDDVHIAESSMAFSKKTMLRIGPVLDVITSAGRQFAAIDIDGIMVFYAPLEDIRIEPC
ncbi:hypothetical protein PH7735_03461 [Shimia thalassica]|uniref:Uncharacterized protein n=1 Tax=Shimia thalassica TaxID=1715693 RepID=A0A0P1IFM6_9RHOB|nr:hypothetical protein [Shimia thalassica]CUK10551.1 hypothetical protein PH7735_03461 [Shimia thalassica]